MWLAMRPATRLVRSPCRSIHYTICRLYSTQPPTPRPYKQLSPEERLSRYPPEPNEPEPTPKTSIWFKLWPFRRKDRAQVKVEEPPDLARGIEASKRFVREGVVDPKYRQAGKHVQRLIWGLAISIGLGTVLFQRRFGKKAQRQFPEVKRQDELR